MRPLFREHTHRDGRPKRKYDQATAEQVARTMQAGMNRHVAAYQCSLCRSWHVGKTG